MPISGGHHGNRFILDTIQGEIDAINVFHIVWRSLVETHRENQPRQRSVGIVKPFGSSSFSAIYFRGP
jgi:hypothetical protein